MIPTMEVLTHIVALLLVGWLSHHSTTNPTLPPRFNPNPIKTTLSSALDSSLSSIALALNTCHSTTYASQTSCITDIPESTITPPFLVIGFSQRNRQRWRGEAEQNRGGAEAGIDGDGGEQNRGGRRVVWRRSRPEESVVGAAEEIDGERGREGVREPREREREGGGRKRNRFSKEKEGGREAGDENRGGGGGDLGKDLWHRFENRCHRSYMAPVL